MSDLVGKPEDRFSHNEAQLRHDHEQWLSDYNELKGISTNIVMSHDAGNVIG